MISSTKLMENKQGLPNVRFIDDKIGNNIFYVPETISTIDAWSALPNFLEGQIKTHYQMITIPGIITNFLGKKLSSQKYYLKIKQELPNFIYSRVPAKQMSVEKTNIFDTSGLINDLLSISKSRSPKMVFNSFNKLIESVMLDYDDDRKNYLMVDGSIDINSTHSDFLNLLIYMSKLNSGKLESKLDGIIYKINNKYFPIAIKKEGKLIFQKNHIGTIKLMKDKIVAKDDSAEALNVTRKLIEKISEKEPKQAQKEIREELQKHSVLQGTFEEKIKTLFNDSKIEDTVKNLSSEVNKKYNGNISIDIKQQGAFNAQKIVGLDEVGNYDKQRTELLENIDESIEDLLHGTLESDPEVNIKILGIKTKIVDDNKNRYKEFQVKIQHKDFGKTTNKPYTISFRVPVPVNGKYIKIGGNNYVMINQLFPKPLQKVAPNLVRFYTHYSTASLSIKNTKLNATNGFKELEEKFIQNMKSLKNISLSTIDNKQKDYITARYNIKELQEFNNIITIKV